MTGVLVAMCIAGLTALSLAMKRHHRQCWGHEPSAGTSRLLRGIGSLMLLAALGLAARERGAGEGLVAAVLAAGVGGAMLVPILAYRPRLAAGLALLMPALALLLESAQGSMPG